MAQLRQRADEITARGGLVAVVSFDPMRRLRGWCRSLKLDEVGWPCLSDESRTTYRAYGLGRAPLWRVFTLRILRDYARFHLRGQRWIYRLRDFAQLGGDFVVDPEGRIAFAYPGQGPEDRPAVQELIEVLPPLSRER